MNKEKKEIRDRIKNMTTVAEFEDLINKILISDEEKEILRMMYKEKKTYAYIADMLGLSVSAVKKKHSNLLMKIGSYF